MAGPDRSEARIVAHVTSTCGRADNRFMPGVRLDAGDARIDQVWLLPLRVPHALEQGLQAPGAERMLWKEACPGDSRDREGGPPGGGGA